MDHPFYFFWRDGPGSRLLPQEVHYMSGELIAGLIVFLQLLVVNGPNLREFVPVVGVLNGRFVVAGCGRTGIGCSICATAFLGTWNKKTQGRV